MRQTGLWGSKAQWSKGCNNFKCIYTVWTNKGVLGNLYPFIVLVDIYLGFPTGRDSATFRDKGTTEQAQNLAKGRDVPGQSVKIRDGTGWYQILTACPIPSLGTKRDRAEKDILKQEKDVLKQKMTL